MTRIIHSVSEMRNAAAEVAKSLRGGDVLLLYGELGSGKTTFAQGLARALGITDPVTSPTFVIASEYGVPPDKGGTRGVSTLVHVDLYRLDSATAAADPAVRDALERAADPGRLTVIEWADRVGNLDLKKAQRIYFQHGKAPEERILVRYP